MPVTVTSSSAGEPQAVILRGQERVVDEVVECWQVDEGWWRSTPLSRRYFRLVLDDGRQLVVFCDLGDGSWWTQRP